MTKKSDATEKHGMHGQKDMNSGELKKDVERMHADMAHRDEGGRASVSDEESGEAGIGRKAVDAADAGDDVIDRNTRRAPPLSDNGNRRE
ncbi:hypothetical protein FGE12_27745 [Aggregicoccus sp. 17bor-14]|uniref:hypothetical protein n=1 Tax=Myxococcaceae TaxID=31 RepID=UPI00129C1D7F|nr:MULTISPECIES: hypothetical protein [Myxococcaceae]MBF5046241.1 hypothetical protein [Simulacricoccus sp. 17bor-14]MRI91964.1 hypothetical protein [Aggregicoccus sp. 17bor-14]